MLVDANYAKKYEKRKQKGKNSYKKTKAERS